MYHSEAYIATVIKPKQKHEHQVEATFRKKIYFKIEKQSGLLTDAGRTTIRE